MKQLTTAWLIVLSLYWFTPYVFAAEPQDSLLWQGRGVVGEVCLQVEQTDYKNAEDVLVWVVSDGETQDWLTLNDWACVPVDFSQHSEIHARFDRQLQQVSIAEDATTSYVTIELPF